MLGKAEISEGSEAEPGAPESNFSQVHSRSFFTYRAENFEGRSPELKRNFSNPELLGPDQKFCFSNTDPKLYGLSIEFIYTSNICLLFYGSVCMCFFILIWKVSISSGLKNLKLFHHHHAFLLPPMQRHKFLWTRRGQWRRTPTKVEVLPQTDRETSGVGQAEGQIGLVGY